jgi:hypothetical protein
MIFLGYNEQQKGWRLLNIKTGRVVHSRNVVFEELQTWKDVASGEYNGSDARTLCVGLSLKEHVSSIVSASVETGEEITWNRFKMLNVNH